MLEPTNRFMLVDALRPPDGYQLDTAVGTTFTLDLDALLLATLSFAMFDHLDTEGGRADPIALLESVRRNADRLTVFAQAGAMWGPRRHPPILAYLEDAVVPVRPAKPGHLFHPKVWALRFAAPDRAPRYRLLSLSRNLTFDSSWDTIVALDGAETDNPPDWCQPVADFVEALPPLAVRTLDPGRAGQIDDLVASLRRVRWEAPPDVTAMRFHPMGPGFRSPKISGERVLVISPFLGPNEAGRLGNGPGADVLVSRAGALDAVGGDAVAGFAETFVLDTGDDPSAATDDAESVGDDEADSSALDIDVEPARPGLELSGLHAKVFFTENNHRNKLYLGSANATGPAFGGNVEFLVEFRLDPALWSIDHLLDAGGKTNLRAMLTPYTPAAAEPVDPTAAEEAAHRLDAVLRDLATAAYEVAVSTNDAEADDYWLALSWDPIPAAVAARIAEHGIEVEIGPATIAAERVAYGDAGAVIESASLPSITSFLSIEARTRVDGTDITGRTLVNARLVGAPADRRERLLASVLDDPDKVLRYLLLLLAELTGDDSLLAALGGGAGAAFDWSSGSDGPPLLETLLRALAREPASLDRVAEFVDDLTVGDGGAALPEAFTDVWTPINAARAHLDEAADG